MLLKVFSNNKTSEQLSRSLPTQFPGSEWMILVYKTLKTPLRNINMTDEWSECSLEEPGQLGIGGQVAFITGHTSPLQSGSWRQRDMFLGRGQSTVDCTPLSKHPLLWIMNYNSFERAVTTRMLTSLIANITASRPDSGGYLSEN